MVVDKGTGNMSFFRDLRVAYTTNYQYNYANQLSQITYPSGRVIAQNLDTLGRLSSIVGTLNSVQTTYASGFVYNPAQQTSALKYGNNLYASFGFYSDTLLLQCLDYSTTNRSSCAHDSSTKFGLSYSFPASPANDGQIAGVTDAVDNGRSAAYTYDSLYRLTAATSTGSTGYPKWGVSEVYDRYGNRSDQNQTFGSPPMNHVILDPTHNRVSGAPYAYDATGNMTNDGVNTLVYDGESRATSATNGGSSGAYTYDGNGLRIKKVAGSTTTVYIFSGSKVAAEYDNGAAPTAPSREYIYARPALLARIDSSGTKYYHQDHLSNRLVTDSSGNTSEQLGHFPFGESWYNGSNDKLLFTSYERDSESGNDYAQARYYISRLGRFASPDYLAGSTDNPQSLNRYSYVLNTPTSLVDPSGTDPCLTMIMTKRRGQRASQTAMNFGPYELGEADPPAQDIFPCVDGGGGGVGGSGDPPLVPPDLPQPPGTTDCNSPMVGCASATSPPNIPVDDPFNPIPPDIGDMTFASANLLATTSQPKPPGPCDGFIPPVGNAKIGTSFGSVDSMHNASTGGSHQGDDYLVPSGTPVVAPFAGNVIYAAQGGGFGNLVAVQNSAGSYFLAHLSTINVTTGQWVQGGSQVALSGSTGVSTGPHLHYEQHGPGNPFIGTPSAAHTQRNRANTVKPCR